MRRKRRKIAFLTVLFTIVCVGFIIYAANSKVILRHLYPIKYQEEIYKYSSEFKIDPLLVLSVIKVESNFNKFAVSNKDAKGLMQITDKTGLWASEILDLRDFSPSNLFDHKTNIRIGCWYLNRLRKEFDGNMILAVTAYNSGSGRVREWLKNKNFSRDGRTLDKIPFDETDKYVKRILKEYEIIKYIYGNG